MTIERDFYDADSMSSLPERQKRNNALPLLHHPINLRVKEERKRFYEHSRVLLFNLKACFVDE
ncbi:CLUMA_CG003596, isoform A [Clunio marinus]|uniref:CLUMA_CG003596, isoform A n=1 Tax=Clunio marinus TaxID=568069 RepID=A0A1J1HU76_9DIPT|nr:CLUMA_CG003596, isoform A [Clunio marinus]